MVWLDKLKLNKQLARAVTDAGYLAPKEVQEKALSRIIGGQDLIAVGPEGCGKTTAYVLGVLLRLKYGVEEAPRALILVPDKESVLRVTDQFAMLNKNASVRVVGLYTAAGMEAQLNALADGADIVVATPDRARAIYLKLGLNLNKIMMFIVDDAALMVKQGMQLPVCELANSITKCQHLVFTTVMHGRLEQMIAPFMNMPAVIEVEELNEDKIEVLPQVLYHVPNFGTKVNLLNLLISDASNAKTVVFVNTRLTAQKVFNSLYQRLKMEAAILKPLFFDSSGFENLGDFLNQDKICLLIVATELQDDLNLDAVDTLIYFELPDETETYISSVIKNDSDSDRQTAVICFITDMELDVVKKIEQATGVKMELVDLPANLIINKDHKETATGKTAVKKDMEPRGEAFHEKKASNNKDYNYSAGTKAKMTKKKKH